MKRLLRGLITHENIRALDGLRHTNMPEKAYKLILWESELVLRFIQGRIQAFITVFHDCHNLLGANLDRKKDTKYKQSTKENSQCKF